MIAHASTLLPPQMQAVWEGIPQRRRSALLGAVGVAAVAVIVFANMARGSDYAVAFSALKDEEAAAIVAKLKESKVPYELGERGTIRVPTNQVEEVRLLVAAQGLTQKTGSGFELFNQPELGLTQFAEKVKYQRALEGELSRTIARLDAVETARVHLAIPQPRLFADSQRDATASIVLELKPGRRLDPARVQGIVQTVTGAVEGLKPENVSLMDTSGRSLADRQALDNPANQSDRRSNIQHALEAHIEDDVRDMLARVLGPSAALVRVGVELDWNQYESNTETFSPANNAPQIRSQRETMEQAAAGAGGGIPGAAANVPSYGSLSGGADAGPMQRRDVVTNYEMSKTVEKLVRTPGSIKRLTVAVALDGQLVTDPTQVDAIGQLASTAAGIQSSRGDIVTVTTLPFAPPTTPDQLGSVAWLRQAEFALTAGKVLATILAPLLLLLVIRAILQRPDSAGTGRFAFPGQNRLMPAPQTAALLGPGGERGEQAYLEHELEGMAQANPKAMAQIVRTWLSEDRSRA